MNSDCARCGAPNDDDKRLGGLCPACLLAEAADPDQPTRPSGFTPPELAALAPLFPQLELKRLISRGGMAAVYEARQVRLDRRVALKILAPNLSRDPAFVERFAREARTLAALDHPGIVKVYRAGR